MPQVQLDVVLRAGARPDGPQVGVHGHDRTEQVQGLVDQMRPEIEQSAAALLRAGAVPAAP